MTDTFISYSRKDIAFAKIVHDSLQSSQLDTWIDWQDIPPSADWFAEIKEAIEQADTFIFIISQASVKSEICNKEIAHAELNNKRLIPIVIGDIDAREVPPTLQALNWIFFTDKDQQYAKAIQDLITAITLDQPWLKAHTRIQNRALEWERSAGEDGYLLHGADLADAEGWLTQASGKDPAPTTLQTQYILASRAQSARRQRRTLSAVAAGLVIAVILGVLAWTQRNVAVAESHMRATAQNEAVAEANMRATAQNVAVAEANMRATAQHEAVLEAKMRATAQSEAETARVEAELQRDVALSRYYADKSAAQLAANAWELALLLAVEAGNRADTIEAVSALRSVFAASGQTQLLLEGHQDSIRSLEWSPDKTMIATAGDDDLTLRIWDADSGVLIHLVEAPSRMWSVAWSPDGSRLLGTGETGFGVWDAATAARLFWIAEEDEKNVIPVWNAGGSAVLAYASHWEDDRTDFYPATFAVYDGYSGEIILASQDDLYKCGWGSVVSHDKSRFVLWKRIKDGRQTLFSHWDTFEGQVFDWSTGDVLWKIPELFGQIEIIWSPEDSKILVHKFGELIQVWEADSGKLLLEIPVEVYVDSISFAPSGDRLLLTRCDREVRSTCVEASGHIWDIAMGTEVAALVGFQSEIDDASWWSPDGERVLTISNDPSLKTSYEQIWDTRSGAEMVHFWGVGVWGWSDDGAMILTTDGLRDAATGVVLAPLPSFSMQHLTWDQAGQKVLAATGQTARVFSIQPGAESLLIHAHPYGVRQAAWDPTHKFILTAGCEAVDSRFICERGGLKIWDALSGELVREFTGHTSDVVLAGWNRTGDQVFSVSTDKTARVWDAHTGAELFVLAHSATGIAGFAWSPDESKILTFIRDSFMRDNNAYLWSADRGELLMKISPVEIQFDDVLKHAEWSPDGSQLRTYTCEEAYQESSGCRVQVWDVETGNELLRLVNPQGKYGGAFLQSPNDDLLLAGNTDAGMVWSAASGELQWVVPNNFRLGDWSSDGSWIAMADSDFAIHIYDSSTGQEMKKMLGHTGHIRQLIWSQDNTSLLSLSADNTIRLWDVSTGLQQDQLVRTQGDLNFVQWSLDERYLLTASNDGAVRIWFTRLADLLLAACEIAPRNMSEHEWQVYFGAEPYRETCLRDR